MARKVPAKTIIYILGLLLMIGISANQASLIGFIATVVSGLFLILPSPAYWLIGTFLLILSGIFATVDGEIARYNGTSSIKGAFCNSMPEQFMMLYTPICMAWGLYNQFHNIYPLIFGFVAVASVSLSTSAVLLPYPLLQNEGLLAAEINNNQPPGIENKTGKIIRWGRFLGHYTILACLFVICTLFDTFAPSFTVGRFLLNGRYICFMVYTMMWLVGTIRNVAGVQGKASRRLSVQPVLRPIPALV